MHERPLFINDYYILLIHFSPISHQEFLTGAFILEVSIGQLKSFQRNMNNIKGVWNVAGRGGVMEDNLVIISLI